MTNWALGTFRSGDEVYAGLVVDGSAHRLDSSMDELLADWDSACKTLDALADDAAGGVPVDSLQVLPPHEPRQIFQAGANYRKHVIDIVAAEYLRDADRSHGATEEDARAFAADMMDQRAASGEPYVFIGLPSAICGAYDDIVLPPVGEKNDWELELALVISKPSSRVRREDAWDHVAAYTICNDITTRDRLYRPDLKAIGTDWLRAKNAPTFLPTGPYLVPAHQVPDPSQLRITLHHNGVLRQDEAASDMIFDIPRLIEWTTHLADLGPGDLLLTGSPAGNGMHWGVFMQPGDVIESAITGLGAQRNTVVGPR